MSWIDLYIDSRTVGAYEKPTFTESEVAKFKDFNKLDEFIYQKEGFLVLEFFDKFSWQFQNRE